MDFKEVKEFARRNLDEVSWKRFNQSLVADHAPSWHQFGLKQHMVHVAQAAKLLGQLSGIDIVQLALLHDIGKIQMFPRAIKLVDAGSDPAPAYIGHERISASIAASNFHLRDADCVVIACHAMSYDSTRPETLSSKLVTYNGSVEKWMLLCAADCYGKGEVDGRVDQRPVIVQRFRDVSEILGLSPDNASLALAIEAVERWVVGDIEKEEI